MNMIRDAVEAVRNIVQPRYSGPSVSENEMDLWARAASLADLGRLTVEWLDGHMSGTPGNPRVAVDVDEDHAPGITDSLIALNLAGFLTDQSQGAYDGPDYAASPWEAWVMGYADDDTVEWLFAVVSGTPYLLWAYPPADSRPRWRSARPVGDEPPSGEGWSENGSHLRWMYRDCGEQAVDAVCAAWQVTIYDPEPGRNDMWAHLRQAAEDRL